MKSQNVLLTRNWDIAKIADAGVARFAQAVDVIGNEGVASAHCLARAVSKVWLRKPAYHTWRLSSINQLLHLL
jgi:hypothetical protein